MNRPPSVIWEFDPDDLKMWEVSTSKCGEWKATRIPHGVVYTQWRYIYDVNDWEPYSSFFVRHGPLPRYSGC